MDDSLLPPWWVRTKHCGWEGSHEGGEGGRGWRVGVGRLRFVLVGWFAGFRMVETSAL